MKFALLIRGQYPQGADMVARHQDDLEMVRRAEAIPSCSIFFASSALSARTSVCAAMKYPAV